VHVDANGGGNRDSDRKEANATYYVAGRSHREHPDANDNCGVRDADCFKGALVEAPHAASTKTMVSASNAPLRRL